MDFIQLSQQQKENMTLLQQVKTALSGNPIKAIIMAIASLVTETEVFRQIISLANQVLGTLANIVAQILKPLLPILKAMAGLALPLLRVFARILAALLEPLQILVPVFEFVGKVFKRVAEIVAAIWNALISAVDAVLFFVDLSGLKISTKNLGNDFDDLGDTAKEAADAMRNIPQGVKVAQRAFEEAKRKEPQKQNDNRFGFSNFRTFGNNPLKPPSAATGGYVASSGIAEVHKGEVIANKSQQGATYVFQGDVYGWNDFKKKVAQANGQIKRKQNTSKYGISRGERR